MRFYIGLLLWSTRPNVRCVGHPLEWNLRYVLIAWLKRRLSPGRYAKFAEFQYSERLKANPVSSVMIVFLTHAHGALRGRFCVMTKLPEK